MLKKLCSNLSLVLTGCYGGYNKTCFKPVCLERNCVVTWTIGKSGRAECARFKGPGFWTLLKLGYFTSSTFLYNHFTTFTWRVCTHDIMVARCVLYHFAKVVQPLLSVIVLPQIAPIKFSLILPRFKFIISIILKERINPQEIAGVEPKTSCSALTTRPRVLG